MEFLNLVPEESVHRFIAEETLQKIEMIPPYCRVGVLAWIFEGHRAGDFLMAVFRNDFFDAVVRADRENRDALKNYALYLHNYTPAGCYGSAAKVKAWSKTGGLAGLVKAERT